MDLVINILKPLINDDNLFYDKLTNETVLINSNFNCGFYLNRENLIQILKYKYKINCLYDSCQYPGIQCKYTYQEANIKVKISFMIFRTGSVLIVGKCSEDTLYLVYNFIKNILITEYDNIYVKNTEIEEKTCKRKKIKKKLITINK